MSISRATIKEMRQILKEDYGRSVSQTEASKIIHTLISYFDLLAKIEHRDKAKIDYDNHKNKVVKNNQ